ncbi:hypothetical protein YPPY47_1710, partial [Yersinia pestis PY-47]
MRADKDRQSS